MELPSLTLLLPAKQFIGFSLTLYKQSMLGIQFNDGLLCWDRDVDTVVSGLGTLPQVPELPQASVFSHVSIIF